MGKSQRTKGAVGERELASALTAGGRPATRVSPLGAGGAGFGDVREDSGTVWQCKRRAASPLYSWLEGCDRLAIRADRKGWLVVLPLEEYLRITGGGER